MYQSPPPELEDEQSGSEITTNYNFFLVLVFGNTNEVMRKTFSSG